MSLVIFGQTTQWSNAYNIKIQSNKYNNFHKYVDKFVTTLKKEVNENKAVTYVHFGDGDYFFLTQQQVGSAKVGKRALSVSYDKLDMNKFKSNLMLNDYICVEFLENVDIHYNKLYPERPIDIYTDILYAGVSSRWFTHTFSDCIGLIGAGTKLNLIKKLLKHKKYQEYLGLKEFTDYIKLPQKFACDDVENLEKSLEQQLKESNNKTKIYLCGMGHVKSYIFCKLKEYKQAVFIDVGSGIDALAGIIDHKRPYMKQWINHHLNDKEFNYNKIDYLQYKKNKDNTSVVL